MQMELDFGRSWAKPALLYTPLPLAHEMILSDLEESVTATRQSRRFYQLPAFLARCAPQGAGAKNASKNAENCGSE